MKHDDVDRALGQASRASEPVDPALLARIAGTLGASVEPVRPLPSSAALVSRAAATCAAAAVVSALALGAYGVRIMSAAQVLAIFPAAAVLIVLAATFAVRETIPGSPRRAPAWAMPAIAASVFTAAYSIAFDDYRTPRFLAQGLICLRAGLIVAIPTAAAAWWGLRRGYVVNRAAAGLTQGALAGLAGAVMLEIHCANFEAPHKMVWHTGVLIVAAAVGALIGRFRKS